MKLRPDVWGDPKEMGLQVAGRAYVLRLTLRPDVWGDPKEWAAQVTERPSGRVVSRTIQRIPNAPPPPPR